jgi:D-3-phosphoglycerate dehydrogenase
MGVHILVWERIPSVATDWLREQGAIPLMPYEGDEWEPYADTIEAIIVRAGKVDVQRLDSLPALKVVGKYGVGFDTIDLDETDRRGIKVTSIPGVNANSVAELGVALLASAARDIVNGDAMVREGRFTERFESRMKQDLSDSKLGIVGAGRIGSRVGQICHGGWGCEIGVFDPFVDPAVVDDLAATTFDTVRDLFAWADNVVVAAPLTPDTRGLVGVGELDALGEEGILVVCSRGNIVNQTALAQALANGTIFGAGLDVYAVEPPPEDEPIRTAPHAVLSPHMGGHTRRTREAMGMAVCGQVWTLLHGGDAPLIDASAWS